LHPPAPGINGGGGGGQLRGFSLAVNREIPWTPREKQRKRVRNTRERACQCHTSGASSCADVVVVSDVDWKRARILILAENEHEVSAPSPYGAVKI